MGGVIEHPQAVPGSEVPDAVHVADAAVHMDGQDGGRALRQQSFQQVGIQGQDQSKLGIVPGKMYDHSRDYILSETDLILRRLNTDYLDVLLLHRPDALMEPDEVAEAFDRLEQSGKVRFFGVSNHKTSQIQLLKKAVRQPLVANQLQLSIPFSSMISSGLEANMATDGAVDRDDSILDYCRLHDITIQAWSPYQPGRRKGPFIDSPEYPELNRVLEELACKYGSTKTGIAAAWIFRHPARMQVIAGSMREDRIREMEWLVQQKGARTFLFRNQGGNHNEASWQHEVPTWMHFLWE